ncbi:MAG: riboflavin synthase [Armatimonadota bacterium]|nr:riboflavin synthase [Armatimonadota bacterium]
MFTGIIETMGMVSAVTPLDRGVRLQVEAPSFDASLVAGESVCVSGVCLTMLDDATERMEFDAVEETLQRSSLGALRVGSRVNLEKSVSLQQRLGGHLVQGHVDGMGQVLSVELRGVERWITVGAQESVLRYIVEKGSIAVDGVSLTVAALQRDTFSLAIIPHTAEVTTLGDLSAGDRVNLEVDILAKYVEKLAAPYAAERSL